MAVHCITCGARHFTVPASWLDGDRLRRCPECPQPYAEELTPIGPQLVIPGCERRPAPTQAQLTLWG